MRLPIPPLGHVVAADDRLRCASLATQHGATSPLNVVEIAFFREPLQAIAGPVGALLFRRDQSNSQADAHQTQCTHVGQSTDIRPVDSIKVREHDH